MQSLVMSWGGAITLLIVAFVAGRWSGRYSEVRRWTELPPVREHIEHMHLVHQLTDHVLRLSQRVAELEGKGATAPATPTGSHGGG